MRVITLVTQKGGSGKSTLTASLTVAAEEAGERVFVLDLDKQGTIKKWVDRRTAETPGFDTVMDGKALEGALNALRSQDYTVIMLDTAGSDDPLVTAAITASDLCLIPARPTMADLEATQPTILAIQSLKKPFAFILNQSPVQGIRRVSEATDGVRLFGVLAEPPVAMRTDHQDAVGQGQGVTEFNPNGKAAEEIRGLWRWIAKKLKG